MAAFLKIKRTKHMKLPTSVDLGHPRRVKVGFPASKSSKSNIEKAIWNEFGTRGGASGGGWGGPIPERPFMRNAVRKSTHALKSIMGKDARKIISGEQTLQVSLTRLGRYMQGQVRSEIIALTDPPNAAITIARKKSNKPLIATGAMNQAVTWVVEDK